MSTCKSNVGHDTDVTWFFSSRVMFKGSSEGEFWYKVNLEALNPEVKCFPMMECEVGRFVLIMVTTP